MRVLIVEDEALIALYLEGVVTELGHEVCGLAESTAEALLQTGICQPDAILMDVRLGHGDSGIDAARRIKNEFDKRCIFISGNVEQMSRKDLFELEPVGLLAKPVSVLLLEKALAQMARAGQAGRSPAVS